MRRLVATILVCALPACGQAGAPADSKAGQAVARMVENPFPPVVDASAPTIADLERRGLVRTDDEPMGWSCGPDCTADGFTAVYMGKEKARGVPDRQFVCPVAAGEMAGWKCADVNSVPAHLMTAFAADIAGQDVRIAPRRGDGQ